MKSLKKPLSQTLNTLLPKMAFSQLRNISMKKKLPIFIIFTIMITVVLTVGTSLLLFLHYNDTMAQKAVNNGVYSLKMLMDDYKDRTLNYASILAAHPGIVKAVATHDSATALHYLTSLSKKAKIDFITVTDANGTVIVRSHNPSKGDSLMAQKSVKMALAGKSNSEFAKGVTIPFSVRAAVPVKNEAGNIIGAVSTGYKLDKTNIVDSLKKNLGVDITIFFKDIRVNTTIKQNGHRVVGTPLDPHITKIVLKESHTYTGKTAILGRPYITTYIPLLGSNHKPVGILFAGQSMKQVLTTSYIVLINVTVITLILILLVSFLVTVILNSQLINPLKITVDALKQVAEGNLNVDIPENQISQDEIGQLLSSLKIMVGNVKELVHEIHVLGETVAASAEEMMASSEEVTKAGEHVVGAITDLAREASEQAVLTEKGNTKIKDIVEGLRQIAAEMEDSEELATKTWENMNQGHKVVQLQESKMEENKKLTTKVNTSIYNLTQMSSEIEEILSVIRAVAEQTNLLAINAAIEAARAKEQGRGFAVVAQQVKSLSEQSGSSVENISSIVHTLQAHIGQIVEEMNQMESVADEGEKSLRDLISMFRNASESVEVITARIKTVSKAADELTSNANHAGTSIEEIATIAEETAAGSEEVSASSEEQTAYMQQIASSAEDLAKVASQLLNKIHRFNVD